MPILAPPACPMQRLVFPMCLLNRVGVVAPRERGTAKPTRGSTRQHGRRRSPFRMAVQGDESLSLIVSSLQEKRNCAYCMVPMVLTSSNDVKVVLVSVVVLPRVSNLLLSRHCIRLARRIGQRHRPPTSRSAVAYLQRREAL